MQVLPGAHSWGPVKSSQAWSKEQGSPRQWRWRQRLYVHNCWQGSAWLHV